ncbi:MAG: efflux RND transporter periplasmic adaptor subunit [bacterium]
MELNLNVPGTPLHRRCGAILLVLLLAVSLPALPLLSGCSGSGDADEGADAGAAADSLETADASGEDDEEGEDEAKKEKSISVNTGRIRLGDLVLPVYADGAVRTPQSVEIKTKVGGELLTVLVRDGDRVRKGQVLARIDSREYEIALQESRYRHLQALSQMAAEADTFTVNHAAVRQFTTGRDQLDAMVRKGTITREEYQNRLLELEMGALQDGAFREAVFEQRTGLAEARMAEERARLNLEYTEIKAPFAGIVSNRNLVAGEIVPVGAVFCTLYNNDQLEAAVNVLEADLGDLEVGRPVLLAIPATGDTLKASVDVISPSLDQASRTCEILVRFANPEGRFRPGMFVRAQIAGIVYHDKLLAPKDALLLRDNRPLVFKREDDRARWLYVDIGLQNDEWVEITAVHSGGSLTPGDEVVVSDHLTLAHEARIKVRKSIPPSDRWDFASAEEGGSR